MTVPGKKPSKKHKNTEDFEEFYRTIVDTAALDAHVDVFPVAPAQVNAWVSRV